MPFSGSWENSPLRLAASDQLMSSNGSVYDESMMALRLLLEPLAMCILWVVTNIWAACDELAGGV